METGRNAAATGHQPVICKSMEKNLYLIAWKLNGCNIINSLSCERYLCELIFNAHARSK